MLSIVLVANDHAGGPTLNSAQTMKNAMQAPRNTKVILMSALCGVAKYMLCINTELVICNLEAWLHVNMVAQRLWRAAEQGALRFQN